MADEEYGSLGTSDLITHIRVDGAIVTEPTALEVCLAHKGYLWIEVEVAGRAAHGSKFELGIDANMKMGHFLAKLSDLERGLRSRPGHPLVGPPSLHAAMLSGGGLDSAPGAFQHAQIERRTVPGDRGAGERDIQTRSRSRRADADFHATVRHSSCATPEVPRAHAFESRDRAAASGSRPAPTGDVPGRTLPQAPGWYRRVRPPAPARNSTGVGGVERRINWRRSPKRRRWPWCGR